ncbi:MAG: hypothetical protein K2Y25_09635 [Pseudomonadaceae bacterium]|nr:hypothetical protein [Pseudomonadaceae bacterium]
MGKLPWRIETKAAQPGEAFFQHGFTPSVGLAVGAFASAKRLCIAVTLRAGVLSR